MADIKYLAGLDIDGNITLNGNQLVGAAINSGTNNPSGVTGQLFYNTGDDKLKVYNDSGNWVNVGEDDTNNYVNGGSISGGTLTLTRSGLSDVTITGLLELGTTSTTALAGSTITISSGQAQKLGYISVSQAVNLDTMETGIATNASSISTNTSNISTNTSSISTNTSSISTNATNIANNTSDISDNTSDISTNTSNISTNTSNISTNTSNISSNTTAIAAKVAKAGDTMTGFLTLHADPTADLHAATKAYVDDSITGQLIYQGGYDASAAPPTGTAVKKGFTYTVTTAGDGSGFFTIPLEIGDLIIAETDNPTAEGDWTEVNKNVDLATTSTVGVASFSSSNFSVSAAGAVTVKNDGIALGTKTTGDYVESLTASTNVSISGGSGEGSTPSISVPHSNIDDRITKRQYAGLIGDNSNTKFDIAASTHGLGSDSSQFMVQLVEVSSGETVYAEVDRAASGVLTIVFSTAPATNAIRVLIIKIG